MPGYSLLPTMEAPVSKTTFRLSNEEMKERNEWIIDAAKRGLSIEEIAHEVGLSVQRVYQIVKPSKKREKKTYSRHPDLKPPFSRKTTPRDAALDDFYKNDMCRECTKDGFASCSRCFGTMMTIECCYDSDGWPDIDGLFDDFILPHMVRPTTPRWGVTWYDLNGNPCVIRCMSEKAAEERAAMHRRYIPESVLTVAVEKGRYPGSNGSGPEILSPTKFK